MLETVDRILVVVGDRTAAAATWRTLLGAVAVSDGTSEALNARITTMQVGDSEVDLLEPLGPGPAANFQRSYGEGLLGVGFTTRSLDALARHLDRTSVEYAHEGRQIIVPASQTGGMFAAVGPAGDRPRTGLIDHIYEVTFVVNDWRHAVGEMTRFFGLDSERFSEITSDHFQYKGVLTLFDPPARLDRVEITQPYGEGAMNRFFGRRGPSLYMCYAETDDVPALAARLDERAARYEFSDPEDHSRGLFIHPSTLTGVLMGVSRTGWAWTWSGRPDLAEMPSD
jgi:hypothetical protein